MNPHARPRESGALLLTVTLMLAILAALAFALGRGAGMGAHAVAADYDRRSAAYLAQAAVAAARWTDEVKCANGSIAPFSLGGGTLSAAVTKGGAGAINVVASATTAAGASATLTRSVSLVDLSTSETKSLGGGVLDTTISNGVVLPQNTLQVLTLTSGQSNALLYWPMSDIPKNSRVLSATLSMTQNAVSSIVRIVNLQRVTIDWDATATWTRARANVAWTGGAYAATVVASASAASTAALQWNVTGLVDSWVSGLLPDDGMLLTLASAGQSASFYSLESLSTSLRPTLSVTFSKPCP